MNPFWTGIVDHSKTLEQLGRLATSGQVPHALLFAGPESVGKRTVARAFASLLLTKLGKDSRAEESLRLLASGNHPDYGVLVREEGKKDISVDATRALCQEIRLKPYFGSSAVRMIDNAHEMSIAASNALLMTLEEPSAEHYLLLVTHAPQRLPATILSRCQVVHFSELTVSGVDTLLERFGLDAAQRTALATLCEGSLAPLGLEPFVHPVSLRLEMTKALSTHLDELVGKTKRVQKEIERFIEDHGEGRAHASSALSLAAQLASDQDDLPLVWRLLHASLRRSLRSAPLELTTRRAELLELSLKAERLCRERNASAQLQLSTTLLG